VIKTITITNSPAGFSAVLTRTLIAPLQESEKVKLGMLDANINRRFWWSFVEISQI